MKIVLFGPPGSGKGTQAKFIEDRTGYAQVSTGDIFRKELREQTPLGLEAKGYMDSGQLVPDGLVVKMVRERLKQFDLEYGYILDGFPRTVPQAEALDEFSQVDLVINIRVDEGILVGRLTSRRSCSDCGTVFNLNFKPPAEEGRCDQCGGALVHRDDDKEETVKNRLMVYHRQSIPVEEYYRERGILADVDGTGTIEETWQNVQDILGLA